MLRFESASDKIVLNIAIYRIIDYQGWVKAIFKLSIFPWQPLHLARLDRGYIRSKVKTQTSIILIIKPLRVQVCLVWTAEHYVQTQRTAWRATEPQPRNNVKVQEEQRKSAQESHPGIYNVPSSTSTEFNYQKKHAIKKAFSFWKSWRKKNTEDKTLRDRRAGEPEKFSNNTFIKEPSLHISKRLFIHRFATWNFNNLHFSCFRQITYLLWIINRSNGLNFASVNKHAGSYPTNVNWTK